MSLVNLSQDAGDEIDAFTRLRNELAATKARLDVARNALKSIDAHQHLRGYSCPCPRLLRDALAALDAPAADTAKPPSAVVLTARHRKVCRICNKPISTNGWPVGAAEEFAELVFPEHVTLNFGYEFAHTACLAADTGGKEAM